MHGSIEAVSKFFTCPFNAPNTSETKQAPVGEDQENIGGNMHFVRTTVSPANSRSDVEERFQVYLR